MFSKTCLSYETILLSTFIEISKSGNFKLLTVKGFPTEDELQEQWEKILIANGKATGDNSIGKFFASLKSFARLYAELELVKLNVMKLFFVIDQSSIDYLVSKGYKIDTTSGSGYTKSLSAALQRSNNLISKINSKLLEMNKRKVEEEQVISIEQTLARISSVMNFNINIEGLTLSKFNEYKRIAKEKVSAHKQASGKNLKRVA